MIYRKPPFSSGFSLIEAAIVLGVVGLVIGAIWAGAAELKQRRIIQQTITGIYLINDEVTRMYKGHSLPTTTASITNVDILSKLIAQAEGFTLISGIIYSPEERNLTIMISDSSIIMQLNYTNTDVCMKVVAGITAARQSKGNLLRVLLSPGSPSDRITTFPYMPTVSQCSPAGMRFISITFSR